MSNKGSELPLEDGPTQQAPEDGKEQEAEEDTSTRQDQVPSDISTGQGN
jgi:hypothetical protein